MSPVGRTLLRVAGACFVAGIACGLAIATWLAEPVSAEANAPDADTIQHLTETYGLTPEQERTLRMIQARFRQDEARILKDAYRNLPPGVANPLRVARDQADQRLWAILDEDQRALWNKLQFTSSKDGQRSKE